jgi:hypothetical protein
MNIFYDGKHVVVDDGFGIEVLKGDDVDYFDVYDRITAEDMIKDVVVDVGSNCFLFWKHINNY